MFLFLSLMCKYLCYPPFSSLSTFWCVTHTVGTLSVALYLLPTLTLFAHFCLQCLDQLALIQKEVQACVQEIDKTKKFYFDEEHSAHDVRDKAKDIEEK